ncbi:Hypp7432 [Branchiostoma lanceolatum]|uniref:Insulin-like 3 n=1 Tax=Branchiostoma lanceolatum TaxID=7740 RepID=A0A8K0EE30_BRALA|nr:Hypp7432 [Branchiostoma lanceolatum]
MPRFTPLCSMVLSVVLIAVLTGTAAQDSSGPMCGRLLVRRFQQLCMDLKRRRSVDDTEQGLVSRLVPHHTPSTNWENVAEPERDLQLMNKRDPDSETPATDIFDVCCERGCSTEELVIYCGIWHTGGGF